MHSFTTFVFSLALSSVSVLAVPVRRAASGNDVLVFQFAGVLEQLETAFYTGALKKFQASDFTAAGFGNVNVPIEVFSGIANDESTHASVIQSTLTALGAQPIQGCQFNFGDALNDVATMAATARVIENVGVSAYLGGANLLEDKKLLVAAASILSVEARHQSVLNILNGATAIPSPFDIALSPPQILAIAGGFISGCSLGITALPSLSVTNKGPITPGTSLTFSSPALSAGNTSALTCQMMVGGAPAAIVFPFNACVVPKINGPVYVFIVNGNQPLLNDLTDQFSSSIVAGPLLTFIDSVPDALGQIARAAPQNAATSTTITPAAATALAQNATAQNAATNTTATGSSGSSQGPITVIGFSNSTSTNATSSSG